MADPLKVWGARQPPDDSWEAFRRRRSALEAQMALDVCNGCDSCGARCIAGFAVTRDEWEAVSRFLATLPVSERERVAQQDKRLPWPGTEHDPEPVWQAACRFRDTERGGCSIYPVRPTICRLLGHTDWLPCPISAVPYYCEESVPVWNDYRRLKRKTWEEWQEEDNAEGALNRYDTEETK